MTEPHWRRRFRTTWPVAPAPRQIRQPQWTWNFKDDGGNEFGRWWVTSVHGGDERIAAPDLPPAYQVGIAIAVEFAVVGSATDHGFAAHVVTPGSSASLLYQHHERCEVGHLSEDATLVSLLHAEHGDWYHPALRVLDLHGTTVAELWDGPGWGLWAGNWSPIMNDHRLLIQHERRGYLTPAIWHPTVGVVQELPVDLRGDVAATWYPDANAVLLTHSWHGRDELYRFDLHTETLTRLPTPSGTIWATGFHADGAVWYVWNNAQTPGAVVTLSDEDAVPLPPIVVDGVAYTDIEVDGVHGLLAEPATPRPHPTIFRVYGHPAAHFHDSFSPVVQAWVDHGFAVLLVNARGCSGYGKAWRDAPIGNPGLTELTDIARVHDWALATGLTDPTRVILFGESWGGYLTLLGAGTQPERWTVGIAMTPVGDFTSCYEDAMAPAKALNRVQFGGTPTEVPDVYRQASPITYVDNVRAPLWLVVSERDPYCPLRQNEAYIARLHALGKPHTVVRLPGGHGIWGTAMLHQVEAQLAFVARHLG